MGVSIFLPISSLGANGPSRSSPTCPGDDKHMQRSNLVLSLLWLSLGLFASPAAFAQPIDQFQRYIRFHNSLQTTIYPVIQAPQDAPVKEGDKGTNCGT